MRTSGAAVQGALIRRMKLLFCALAGRDVGYGHLKRCLSIAECARRQGLETAFLVLGEGADIARRQGYAAVEAPWPGIMQGLPFEGGAAGTIAILDVTHPMVFSRLPDLYVLLQTLRKFAHRMAAIDSLGRHSFAAAVPSIPVDVLVIPYVGAAARTGISATKLVGPEYALLSPEYASMPLRSVNETAERILVTFGGADPKALTGVVLVALAQIRRRLAVRVVIGPLFAAHVTATVEVQALRLHHDVELVFSPQGLVEHMWWADIAVAASGLVKYELAATGTPGILVSIDEAHELANRPFARERLQTDIGVTADPVLIGHAIEELLDSATERRGMAERGQRLIDGKGAERLIAALTRLP